MKQFLIVLAFVISSSPIFAQTEEPTATPIPEVPTVEDRNVIVPPDSEGTVIISPNENPVLLAALGVFAVVIVFFAGGFVVLANRLGKSLPPEIMGILVGARPIVTSGIDTGFNYVDRLAKVTPNTLDDLLAKYTREELYEIIDAFYGTEPPK